jgi:multidrug efflux pump subunit AcrB
MDCKFCQEKLSDYIDNQMSGEEKQQIENHLKQCSHCAKELEDLKFVLGGLKELPEIDPPKNLCENINKKIKTEQKPMISRLLNNRWFSLGAAAAAVVLIFVFTNLDGMFLRGSKTDTSVCNEQQDRVAVESQELEVKKFDDYSRENSEAANDKDTFKIMGSDSEQNLMETEIQHISYNNFSADLNTQKASQALDFLEKLDRNYNIKNFNVKIEENEVIVIFDIPVDVLHELLEVISNEYKLENINKDSNRREQKDKTEEDVEFVHIELHIEANS